MRYICISIVATLMLAGTVSAATINVPADYTTIQLAFDAASSGDEILVAPGTYTSSSYAVVEMNGKSVFLRSSGGPDVTTIDCQSSGPGIRLYTTSTSGTKIHGFTIRNGMGGGAGGAIDSYATNLEIEDCVFLNNEASRGGGVSLYTGTVTNCEFKNNIARHQNGTFSWGGAIIVGAQCEITGCHFEGNEAIDGSMSEGGAVFGNVATVTMTNCTFTGNHATHYGGAFSFFGGGSTQITDCLFTDNLTGPGTGAGGAISQGPQSSMTIVNSEFKGNSAYEGGAIDISASALIADSLFCENAPSDIEGTWTDGGGNEFHIECPTSNFSGLTARVVGVNLVDTGATNNWTVDIYASMGEGERLDAVAGTSGQLKTVSSTEGFWQSAYGGPTSQSINPAFYSVVPELRYDSRVTIGAYDSSGDPFPENSLGDVGIDFTNFENGGALAADDGTWYVLPTDVQGGVLILENDDCEAGHGVLIARLTAFGLDSEITLGALFQGRNAMGVTFQASAIETFALGDWADCNTNGSNDACDIANGGSEDTNGNGVPDECECPADVNGDGFVNVTDILSLIEHFGTTGPQGDVDGDGFVGVDDLLIMINAWGPCP